MRTDTFPRLAIVTGSDSGIGQATPGLPTLMAAHGHDHAGSQWRRL